MNKEEVTKAGFSLKTDGARGHKNKVKGGVKGRGGGRAIFATWKSRTEKRAGVYTGDPNCKGNGTDSRGFARAGIVVKKRTRFRTSFSKKQPKNIQQWGWGRGGRR